jgi:uncharacterized membrane protein
MSAMSGRSLHPLLIHFPIALLVIGVAFDCVGLARRRLVYHRAALYLLMLGLLGGLASALIGFRTGDAAGSSATLHQLWAIATLVVFGGLLLLRFLTRERWTPPLRGMYVALAVTGIVALAITGFYGTELIAGFGDLSVPP